MISIYNILNCNVFRLARVLLLLLLLKLDVLQKLLILNHQHLKVLQAIIVLLLLVTIDFISRSVGRDLALAVCCYVVIMLDTFFAQLALRERSHPLLGVLRLGWLLLFMLMSG